MWWSTILFQKRSDGAALAASLFVLVQSFLIVYNTYVCKIVYIGRDYRRDASLFDIHCHIIPGVDDGASDTKEALAMLRAEYEQGVRTIIATPHFRRGMFETPEKRSSGSSNC